MLRQDFAPNGAGPLCSWLLPMFDTVHSLFPRCKYRHHSMGGSDALVPLIRKSNPIVQDMRAKPR